MRIAIDAMGGDHAPRAIVEGAVQAAKTWPDLELILVGDEEAIRAHVQEGLEQIRIQHAAEVIAADEEPVKAVRTKKDSSMVVGARLVREGSADAFISAGNTGALMAAGLLIIGRLPGIDRPALSPVLPTTDGKGVLVLDVGANADAKPHHLLQYALMGSLYSEHVLGVKSPRIGLLNVGTEENKGNQLCKETYPLLQEAPVRFIGNVEARDIPFGVCDVAVCDGFAGNILLKAMEGTAQAIFTNLKEIFLSSFLNKLAAAVLKSSLLELKDKLDYKEYGGAPLLGLKGACFKAHGSSDARAIYNAIDKARIFHEQQVIAKMSERIAKAGDGNE